MMEIIEQKVITSPLDIMDANIIDFGRLNGCWKRPSDAVRTIFSWFDRTAVITIADIPNFLDAPDRGDWPGWEHPGWHVDIGKKYWNWFFWNHPEGKLFFSDSPDFYGQFAEGESFWGDIGTVSASAFALTQKGMGIGDLWISVLGNGTRHVIIESRIDILQIYSDLVLGKHKGKRG